MSFLDEIFRNFEKEVQESVKRSTQRKCVTTTVSTHNAWDVYAMLAMEHFINKFPGSVPADAARRTAEFADALVAERAKRFPPKVAK